MSKMGKNGGKKGVQSNHLYTTHYIPVSKSDFDIISIQITGDLGIPVHFITGKTIVKLHFRQRTTEK